MKKETYAMYGDILPGRSFFWRWAAQSRLPLPMPEPLPEAFWTSRKASAKCELYVSGNIIKNVKSVIGIPTRTV